MDLGCVSLAFIDGLGAPEMVLIFVVVLLLFGGEKLPEFARGMGKSIREFKKAAAGVEEEFKRALDEDERKHTLAQLPPPAPGSSTPTDTVAHDYDPMHDDYHHDEYGNPIESKPAATATTDPAGPGSPSAEPTAATTDIFAESPATPAAPAEPAGVPSATATADATASVPAATDLNSAPVSEETPEKIASAAKKAPPAS